MPSAVRVTVFLGEGERKAVRAALDARGAEPALADFAIERPLSAAALTAALVADPTSFLLEGRMVFLSLGSELAGGAGHARLERAAEHWQDLLARLRRMEARAYVLNVFRRVVGHGDGAPLEDLVGLRARIRRLNRFGDELAARGDAVLVDVDRVLGAVGGRGLQTDFRWPHAPTPESAVAGAARAVTDALNRVVVRPT